jgi:hypothetical protein
MANVRQLFRTVAIDVSLYFNVDVLFCSMYFRFRLSKTQKNCLVRFPF